MAAIPCDTLLTIAGMGLLTMCPMRVNSLLALIPPGEKLYISSSLISQINNPLNLS